MRAPYKFYQGQRVRFKAPDREWLFYHYVILDESKNEVVRRTGGGGAIQSWLEMYGIRKPPGHGYPSKSHSLRMSGKNNPAWRGGNPGYQKRQLLKVRKKKCEWCGTSNKIQLHHIDHNRRHGKLSNLMWLCGHCNTLECRMWALKKSKRALIEVSNNRITITFTRREGV